MNTDTPSTIEDRLVRTGQDMLSHPNRAGHVLLLLAAAGMAVLLAALLLTEPDLPRRTVAAFALMLAIALAWCGHAVHILANRRPLYGRHRLVAGWMATAFTGLYTVGAGLLWLIGRMPAAGAAAVAGFAMFALALFMLNRAMARVRQLESRRAALERSTAR